MDNFFFGGTSIETTPKEEEVVLNTSNGFFGGTVIEETEEETGCDGNCSADGFFRDCDNNESFSRDYAKGKSFNFSVWNAYTNYVNDEFKQDFVTYNGKLYACVKSNTNVKPGTSDEWISVIETNLTWTYI